MAFADAVALVVLFGISLCKVTPEQEITVSYGLMTRLGELTKRSRKHRGLYRFRQSNCTPKWINDGARDELERRIKQADITGMSFVQVWGEPATSTTT